MNWADVALNGVHYKDHVKSEEGGQINEIMESIRRWNEMNHIITINDEL